MAYPFMPAVKRRPVSVTVAAALLFVAAAALVGVAVAQFSVIGPTGRALEATMTNTADRGFGTAFAAVLFGGGGAVNVLFGLSLGLLAAFDLRGKRPARIMSWIIGPLALVCCGCGSAVYTDVAFANVAGTTSAGGRDLTTEQMAAMGEALPAWFTAAVLILVAVMALSVATAMVLLGVPPSNAFFRKEPEGWLPPTGWPGGYPSAPAPYPAPWDRPSYPEPGTPPPAVYPPPGEYPSPGEFPPRPPR